ncbi:TPA: MiaB/RimO family radical SAM methylthiotransferase [Candidatus Peregrinibacteria bacterium]|nr:MiaB/RimO family radical SAM methylthiotransferase [Candidatus Peregrinibacteria bacterium]HIQ57705.1 MiaB/RimO family radical SAM methylthiotransferase [Candidatus Gracilibacteria bacterium]
MKTYFIKTFGCQMNHSDSEKLSAVLDSLKLQEVQTVEESDLVIFNTCSIKQHAEDRVFGHVNNAKKAGKIVAITGCMIRHTSSLKDLQNIRELKNSKNTRIAITDEEIKKKLEKIDEVLKRIEKNKSVDFVFRIEDMKNLPEILYEFDSEIKRPNFEKIKKFDSLENFDYLNISPKLTEKYRATVPIMTGCDKFCTYCIVPFARGKERSRKFEDILEECNNHVKNGVIEITLVGQNVNAYFLDDASKKILQRHTDFAFLLNEIAEIKGLKRLQFTSPHPRHMGGDMIEVIAKHKNISRCIHLPVQTGSTRMLQKMGREHNIGRFTDFIEKLRKAVPEMTITTDIIVGFCTETEKDFQKTIELFETQHFLMAFISKYSPRKGTVSAEKMEDDVSDILKKERLEILTKVLEQSVDFENKKLIGKIEEVIIDSVQFNSEKNEFTARGRSHTGRTVVCKVGDRGENFIGKIVSVKITDYKKFTVFGKLL